MGASIPCRRALHFLLVPVLLNGSVRSEFVLDSGIGVNLLTSRLGQRLGLRSTGERMTGRRMSGQEISTEVHRLPALGVGEHSWKDVPVVVFDLAGLPPALAEVGGFLSLGLFEQTPVTIRYQNPSLVVGEGTPARAAESDSVSVPIVLHRNGPEVTSFIDLELPGGHLAHVEVDMGSDSLILHRRFQPLLGVPESGFGVAKVEGTDETGYRYTRYRGRISGPVFPAGSPELAQRDPEVIFQEIIYDGLVGDAFLRRFEVTFDLPRSRLLFRRPS